MQEVVVPPVAAPERPCIRVLLMADAPLAGPRLAEALRARGLAVSETTNPLQGLSRLRAEAPEIVVLGVPLAEADPIALCAALKEGPSPPVLLLVDGAGLSDSLEVALPGNLQPDAVLPSPADPARILIEIHAALQREARADAGPDGPFFPEVLVEVCGRAETGVLEVRQGGVCTAIYLREGRPVFVEGGALRETLGRLLLRRGEIAERDYVRVVERMTERTVTSETLRMGEVLVELGILSPEEIRRALAVQMREKILACFRSDAFQFDFSLLGDLPEDAVPHDALGVESLVLAGVRAHFGPDRISRLLAAWGKGRPRLLPPAEETAARFEMTAAERRLLEALRGDRDLDSLQALSILDPVHTGQVVAALAVSRVLSFDEGTPAAVTRAKIGPPPAAREPRAAPRSAAPKRAEAQPATAQAGAEQSAPAGPARVRSADSLWRLRRSLGAAPPADAKAAAGEQRGARLDAERCFRQGRRLLEQGLVPGAQREFARAAELQPEETEYVAYEAWSTWLAARGEEARTLCRAKAQACVQRLLERDPDCTRAHSMLGQLLYAGGDLRGARRHFSLALRGDADDVDAQRGMRMLARRLTDSA
jgi:tetratricopeptide (TPR) repeat protein